MSPLSITKSCLRKSTSPAQFRHLVGASVNVVQDEERTVGSRRPGMSGTGAEPACKRCWRRFCRRGHCPRVSIRRLAAKKAVAVLCSGTQVFQPHAVERFVRLFAACDRLVMTDMFGGIETASVVFGHLDPRQCGFVGGPQDGYAVGGHVAQPWAVRNPEILGRQRQ